MKCFVCKKEIENELNEIHISDGDFACSPNCITKYYADQKQFFDNIHNDLYVANYLGIKKQDLNG